MRNTDIIILSGIDWNFSWQRHQILATYFAKKGFRVNFVNSTMVKNPDLKHFLKRLKRKFSNKKNKDYDLLNNLKVIRPLIMPSTNTIFRIINNKILLKRLLKKFDSLLLQSPIIICYIPNQTTLDIINHIKPSLVIYDCVSNYTSLKGIPKDTQNIEDELIEKSDIVTADSDYLIKKLKAKRNEVVQIMPGVDYELFSHANIGPVKKIKKICYFGGIREDTIDIDLLFNLTNKLKNFEFLFVGPVNSDIPDFPANCKFVGKVPHSELPLKIKHYDCILLPYKINDFTQGVIPSKFYEAFATGKPIIATPLDNFMPYKDIIILAQNVEEFVNAIENIEMYESDNKFKKRISVAKENSWEKQCCRFLNLIAASKIS